MTQVVVDGLIMGYEKVGKGSRTPLLILHGWMRSKTEWREVARRASSAGECVVYLLDLPGFGESNLPHLTNGIDEYAEYVAKFCQCMKIGTVRIVGHSLGGRVGIVLASEDKMGEAIEKLFLVDPAGVKTFSITRTLLLVFAKIFSFVPEQVRRRMIGLLMDEDYRQAGSKRGLYREIVKADLRSRLGRIKCPTTLVWGENDPVLPISQVKIYRKYVNDILVRVVWGAGHDPHLTHPEQFGRLVEELVE